MRSLIYNKGESRKVTRIIPGSEGSDLYPVSRWDPWSNISPRDPSMYPSGTANHTDRAVIEFLVRCGPSCGNRAWCSGKEACRWGPINYVRDVRSLAIVFKWRWNLKLKLNNASSDPMLRACNICLNLPIPNECGNTLSIQVKSMETYLEGNHCIGIYVCLFC